MAKQNEEERAASPGGSLRWESPESLGKLLGLLTHDFRNPLAALASNVGFLQMISKEMSEEAREALQDLQLSVEALGRMADSLEFISHDLSDRAPVPPSPLAVGAMVRGVRPAAERSALSHRITLEFAVEQQEGTQFMAGERAFSRALSGLIHNALSVAPSGSVVKVRALRRLDEVVFRVEDDGPALSPAMLVQVSTAAAQDSHKSERAARYSRGLGLYIVARSADAAGVRLCIGEGETKSVIELVAAGV